jgi:hypothetical protein
MADPNVYQARIAYIKTAREYTNAAELIFQALEQANTKPTNTTNEIIAKWLKRGKIS